MRRIVLTCAGAVVALALTATPAHAQVSVSIGNPYYGSGVFVGSGYGFPGYGFGSSYYSSGYYGLGAPVVGVAPVYGGGFGYPYGGAYRYGGFGYPYGGYRGGFGYPVGVYRRGYYGGGYGYRAPYGVRRGWGRY